MVACLGSVKRHSQKTLPQWCKQNWELHLERGRIEFCLKIFISNLMMLSLFLTDVLFIQEIIKSDQLLLQLKINMGAG